MKGSPPQQTLNVDLSAAQDITCENCGNYTFEEVVLMKKLSALLSPTGKEAIIPIPSFACNACGYINKQFLPVTMNSQDKQEKAEQPETPRLTLEK